MVRQTSDGLKHGREITECAVQLATVVLHSNHQAAPLRCCLNEPLQSHIDPQILLQ